MLKKTLQKLKRLIILETVYEYRHILPQTAAPMESGAVDVEYFILKQPEDVESFQWESPDAEAQQIRKLLEVEEFVGIIHEHGRVCGRIAVRTSGWYSISSRLKFRRLRSTEGYLHFVRTSGFARGRGYQAKMYSHFLTKSNFESLEYVTSTVHVGNVPSIKSTERTGGIRVAEVRSIGFLGGRLGVAFTKKIGSSSK